MRRAKSLYASAAIAALLAAAPALSLTLPKEPSRQSLIISVQASAADAEAALNDALAKLEAAKAEGADLAPFEAAVEEAKANLAAARDAEAAAKAAADAEAAAQAEAAAKAAAEAEAAAQAEAAAKAAADADAAAQAEAAAKAAADAEAAAKASGDAEAAAKAAAEAEAAKAAEADAAAKAAADAEAAKAAGDADAAAKAAAEAEAAAKAAADAEAAKTAGDAEAAAKAAADTEAAAKAAADAELAAKAAAEAEAIKLLDADAAAKAVAEAEAAAKAAADAAAKAAADAETAKSLDAEAAAKAAAEAEAATLAAAAAEAEAAAKAAAAPPALEVLPEAKMQEAAPVLDSFKEIAPPPPPPVEGQAAAPAAPPVTAPPAGPPPVDDTSARSLLLPLVIGAIGLEVGERIDVFPPPPPPPQEEVVRIVGGRTIITINNVTYVDAPDSRRLAETGDEIIIERLPRGRTRETIVRDNGVQVVTIKNRWGDVIQRSRILPDGREVILAYTPEYDREDYVEWRDPVYDLPPLVLRVPVREYTLNASLIEDDDDYFTFLEKPPVERVERIYSVRDVKRSARVRDKARRIEMGNITFGFGTADIEEEQIDKLQGMADAMLKLIKKNPAETFLIEGHTDAVGSGNANLALSDKRAESVAIALNNVFDVPSENLTTQGYGERYLKVKTEAKEPLNRRVVFRRITPLVQPVASAE